MPRALLCMGLSLMAHPALAQDSDGLQCVPYARDVSGIRIYGDAHTWWGQAAGKYERGSVPAIGAVMAFKPHGVMRLGHVAAVSRIIDTRTILIRHSNWSTINGRRGQIEDDVQVVDVSPENDWSEVRVWYTPINGLGSTHYPLHGFIYSGHAPKQPKRPLFQMASATPAKPAAQKPAAIRQSTPAPREDPIGDLIGSLGS